MARSIGVRLAACALLLLAAAPSLADEAPAVPGFRGEVIANMMDAGDKIIELAGAVPARKWAWRPGRGVRSVGEVYLHVVQGNYFMCAFLGAKPPMDPAILQNLDTAPLSRERTVEMLKESYAFTSKVIAETPDAELASTVDFLGGRLSRQGVMMAIAAHSHEHLGQSIAYARTNGVVPPWTAREKAAAKQAAETKKPEAPKQGGGGYGHSH